MKIKFYNKLKNKCIMFLLMFEFKVKFGGIVRYLVGCFKDVIGFLMVVYNFVLFFCNV